MQMVTTEEPITTDEASRKLGIDRSRGRRIALESGIAIPWGEGQKRTFVRVMYSDFREAVLSQRMNNKRRSVPMARPKTAAGKPLHPDVRC